MTTKIHSLNTSAHRQLANFGLTQNEVTRMSHWAIETEKYAIPAMALLAMPGVLKSLQQNLQNTGTQTQSLLPAPQAFNRFWTQISSAAFGNLVIDGLSTLGEADSRPASAGGNALRTALDIVMLFGNQVAQRLANMIYPLTSAIIAMAWAVQNNKGLKTGLESKETFFGKFGFQLNAFKDFYLKELPGFVKNLNQEKLTTYWKEFRRSPIPYASEKLTTYGYFVHALLAAAGTGILLLSNLLPHDEKSLKTKGEIHNETESLGWSIAKASRLPLFFAVLADAFNPFSFASKGPARQLYNVASIAYAVLIAVHSLFMHIPGVSILLDFLRNTVSNDRSFIAKYMNRTKPAIA